MTGRRLLLVLAGLNGLLAVGLGAFGAHAVTDPQAKAWLETAAQFQLPHAVAVVALAALAPRMKVAAELVGMGALMFAGGLQALALGVPRGIVVMAPVGGALMMLGWALVIVNALRR